tara:strand:- start:223 stop:1059 length:837 start_codon:yes stop_codon:yes gene_type:complete
MKIKNKLLLGIAFLVLLINIIGIVAQGSSTETQFYNNFDYPFCYAPSDNLIESFWVQDGMITRSIKDCYRNEGIPEDYCCPILSSTCNNDNTCIDEGIQHCNQYTESECEGHPNIARNDLQNEGTLGDLECGKYNGIYGSDKICFNYLSCQCKWDDDEKKCNAISEHQIYNPDNGVDGSHYGEGEENLIDANCGDGTPITGNCTFSLDIVDDCDTTEFLTRGWVANWSGSNKPDYCKSGEDRIPCLKVIKLGFFSVTNLIIAVIAIIIIYIIIKKKKK